MPAGRGVEDGEEVLEIVAKHPATAQHLAKKLAVRFVSDDPPQALIDRLARVLEGTEGDLRQVVEALVESPEFWADEARFQKIKSPFELTASALRALDADIERPRETIEWIGRMGQPLYAYQAPTGYPDRADFWVNSGALLNRMNFGLALAADRVRGVDLDLAALNDNKEPESRLDALETYVELLLPERDPASTVAMLEPMVLDPQLSTKVDAAAPEPAELPDVFNLDEGEILEEERESDWSQGRENQLDPSALEQVVGAILGSPEFQRK